MAWVFGGKKFGQYTYEHWFDDDKYNELKIDGQDINNNELQRNRASSDSDDSTNLHKPPQQQ